MSAVDCFWETDPLPVTPEARPDRCCQCWREVYGSFPNKPLCREHFWEEQQQQIAAIVASHQQKAS
jgi:hypothetical protein